MAMDILDRTRTCDVTWYIGMWDGRWLLCRIDNQNVKPSARAYQPTSPPMTTSPPPPPALISSLTENGTTPAVIGNSTGAVLTMRTTLPEPGISRTEKGAVAAVLGVELDDLLVVVGALEELHPRVERPPVRLEQHLHAVDRWVERVGA